MTAKELGKLLELSGTGKDKLATILAWVKENPNASEGDLIEYLHDTRVPDGTLAKAEAIVEGNYRWPPELLGAAKAIDPDASSGSTTALGLNWDAMPDEEIPEHEITGGRKGKRGKKAAK